MTQRQLSRSSGSYRPKTAKNSQPVDMTARLSHLSSQDLGSLVQDLCTEQRLQWQEGHAVPVEAFFEGFPDLKGTPEAFALIEAELRWRQSQGEDLSFREILQRFPEHAEQLQVFFSPTEHVENLPPKPKAPSPTSRLRQYVDQIPTPSHSPWPDIPGYTIVRELGRGGMGVVYQATQNGLDRTVALKMILGGSFTDLNSIGRFDAEAKAIARLHHPNIVQIFATGALEQKLQGLSPQPYLVLELVDGGNLGNWMSQWHNQPEKIATMAETLARAVHHAHLQGIIHRDLKPSNILLTPDGQPKIADFGLVKFLDNNDSVSPDAKTQTGMFVGTPEYVAPEQFGGEDLTPRVDIYALGVILYEMLTGRRPFEGANAIDTLEMVRDHEPIAPSRIQPGIPTDLETICLKCLQKEPDKRYATAQEMAEDLHRFQIGLPILARPISRGEKVWRWCRRNPVIATLLSLLIFVFVSGFAMVTWKWKEATGHRDQARAKAQSEAKAKEAARMAQKQAEADKREADLLRHQLERRSSRAFFELGQNWCERGHIGHGLHWMARSLEIANGEDNASFRDIIQRNLSAWQSHLIHHHASLTHRGWVWSVVPGPSGKILATAGRDSTVRLWDPKRGAPIGEPLRHNFPVWALSFTTNGKCLATGSGARGNGEIRIYDVATQKLLGKIMKTDAQVGEVCFSPDGKTLLSFLLRGRIPPNHYVGQVQLWDVGSREKRGKPLPHPGLITTSCFGPKGQTVLTGGTDGTVRQWSIETGEPQGEPLAVTEETETALPFNRMVVGMALSPDRKCLLTSHNWILPKSKRLVGGDSRLWNLNARKPKGRPMTHKGAPMCLDFSADGQTIAIGVFRIQKNVEGRFTGETRVWDARTSSPLSKVIYHDSPVWTVALSPEGQLLATGTEKGRLKIWQTATGKLLARPLTHGGGPIRSAVFDPNGTYLANGFASGSRLAKIWKLRPAPPKVISVESPMDIRHWAISPNAEWVAGAESDGTTHLWSTKSGKEILPPLQHPQRVEGLAFTPDNQALVTGCEDGHLRFWSLTSGKVIRKGFKHPMRARAILFSRNEETILTWGSDRKARSWNLKTGKLIAEMTGLRFRGSAGSPLAMSGDVVIGTPDHQKLGQWDRATGKQTGSLPTHPGPVRALILGSNGNLLTGCEDGIIRQWSVQDHKQNGPSLSHPSAIWSLTLSPDEKRVAVGGKKGYVRIWDRETGLPLGPSLPHPGIIKAMRFTPDGRSLVVCSVDNRIRIWTESKPFQTSAATVQSQIEKLTGCKMDEEGNLQPIKVKQSLQAN